MILLIFSLLFTMAITPKLSQFKTDEKNWNIVFVCLFKMHSIITDGLCNAQHRFVLNYKVYWRIIKTGRIIRTKLVAHVTAELGATGIIVLFPIKLLHPSPSQAKQWLGFVHFVVSDKQPREIDFAENTNENSKISSRAWSIQSKKCTYRFCGCSICHQAHMICMVEHY